MPSDACQWLYECEACHEILRPEPGECCVFCSYGTVPCPPVPGTRKTVRQLIKGAQLQLCDREQTAIGCVLVRSDVRSWPR